MVLSSLFEHLAAIPRGFQGFSRLFKAFRGFSTSSRRFDVFRGFQQAFQGGVECGQVVQQLEKALKALDGEDARQTREDGQALLGQVHLRASEGPSASLFGALSKPLSLSKVFKRPSQRPRSLVAKARRW